MSDLYLGEYQRFLYCFTLAPRFGDKRILAKVENGELLIRPNSVADFKAILASQNLMQNPGVVGLVNWFSTDKERYIRFRK